MQSPHNTNRLRYFSSDVFYMVISCKVFIECKAKEFDSWDFCKNWISNSNLNCLFLVGDYHIWRFTDVERMSVGLESTINTYQLPIHSGMDIVTVTVGCKNCRIISKMNKTNLIWGSINVIDIQKKEYWANTEPCGTPNVMFDIEELQLLIETYCFLLVKYDSNQCCMIPLTTFCRSLLINMLWLTASNAFEESRYAAMVLCLLSKDE